jgi:hypothetical protein
VNELQKNYLRAKKDLTLGSGKNMIAVESILASNGKAMKSATIDDMINVGFGETEIRDHARLLEKYNLAKHKLLNFGFEYIYENTESVKERSNVFSLKLAARVMPEIEEKMILLFLKKDFDSGEI